VIVICLLALVALLLLASIGAFFLCFPVLPIALVAVLLLGMVLLFLLGFWVGATWILEPRLNHLGMRRRLVRVTAETGTLLATEDDERGLAAAAR
jgi:hypothetical protein